MVGFFGDLSDLVSSVTTVVSAVSKEVVNDVKVAVKELNKDTTSQKQPPSPPPDNDRPIPSSLDLHYITDQLLVMPQPTVDAWTAKCYFDPTQEDIPFEPNVIPHRNDVVVLAEYLDLRQTRVFHVSDQAAEETVVRALQGQLVHLPWRSPPSPRSETPCVSALLDIVYALHAHLSLDNEGHTSTTAVVYCENGRTRSALVIACYLCFTQQVRTVAQGFVVFLQQTQECMTQEQAQTIWDNHCPPSLQTFGRNFETTVRQGYYHNPKPLLLRAIALQGVPVEDKPCLDLWDGQQRHIWSSHPELWTDLVDEDRSEWETCSSLPIAVQPPSPPQSPQSTNTTASLLASAIQEPLPPASTDDWIHFAPPPQPEVTSQWADEEGFYRVNVVLEGDFCLLCRFGGVHAGSDKDTSKILFRYANTTVAMAPIPYELPPNQVDLMRRYASCFDPDDFLCTLLLDAHWNAPEVYWQERLNRPCQGLPPVYEWNNLACLQRGWHLLQQCAVVQPTPAQIQQLMTQQSSQTISVEMAKLCLQRSNLNVDQALADLSTPTMARLWQVLQPPPPPQVPALLPPSEEEEDDDDEEDDFLEPEAQNILEILDSVDFGDEFQDEPTYDHLYDFSSLYNPKKKKKKEGGPNKKKRKQSAITEDDDDYSFPSPHLQMPRQGEILDAFGEYYDDIHHRSSTQRQQDLSQKPLVMGESMPQIPLHVPSNQPYVPIDDPNNAAALELLLKMNNAGIQLRDLTQLLEESQHWNKPQPQEEEEEVVEEEKKTEEGVLEAQGTGGKGATAVAAKPLGAAPPLKDHPQFSIYFKQIKSGTPLEQVKEAMTKDGKDPTIADLDPEKSLSSQRPSMADHEVTVVTAPNAVGNAQKALQEALLRKKSGPKTEVVIPKRGETKEEEEKEENPQAKLMAALNKNKAAKTDDEDMPLRTDPEYAKYFKMLKMGMSKEQIQHAMKRDEKDPTIIELDPERSLKAQRAPPAEKNSKTDDGPPLKEDPTYKKYFKMLKMGMAKEQVSHALQRDGKDPNILDLDPTKSLKSQQSSSADTGPPLKDDEEYKKYFKMLKMGMAKEQVVHALQRDGKDPAVLDMDPEKSLASQQAKKVDDGPPLKDDPEYAKYFKMVKMGLPKDAVKNALVRDGNDPSIMDLDPEKSVKSQLSGGDEAKDDGPPLKEDPEYVKYFKMLNMGLPKDAVKNALARDGKDPSIMDLDPEKSIKSQLGGSKDEGPPLKEDPEYVKYFKMLNMGLPKDAVKNALARDGKDPSIMDLDPNKSLKFQMGGGGEEEKDTGTPLKDDPEYMKYFKMMNMGLPKDAVKNALSRDGKDPAVMDLDPNKSVEFQMRKKSGAPTRRTPVKKKKKVRRKKIYWNPIEQEQVKEDSIWNLVRGSVRMDTLNYDIKEFEDLFTESADPADRKKNKRKKTDASKQKKSVQVIDGKRSMNGGIILARMKVEYTKIASSVNEMQHRKFDATQMKALKEFLPTIDERQGLKMYMKAGEEDPAAKEKLYKDLSECEKYMYTMIDVPKGSEKFDCMLFRSQFKVRFEDLLDAIDTVESACDETRNSERLRKMMAMILTLVNQINTGGEGKVAAGFGLDALLKLNEAKAFDKKTSVLMYLAKLVKKNDETLLGFQEDLSTARHAENIILDSLASDIKTVEAELEKVHATAAEEAARLEANGELKPFSLQDLKELKTTVYNVGGVQHFNKIEHQSGRTPMERFALNSHDALKQATTKIEKLKTKYQSLLLYFGEDEKMPSNEFFGLMRRFLEEFQKACDMVDKMEAQRIKEEKRNAKQAEKERRKSAAAALPSKHAMADLAKKAVAKKGALGKVAKGSTASAMGGIAALAAVAAAGKRDKASPTPGGIGAMAALAASKKRETVAPPAGGIAALAALAASKKGDDSQAPTGGIAAMAAMASKKKGDKPATSSGGLAAMAAMASKKKGEKPATSGGGLAVMAAMASKKKGDQPETPGGGLAAMAAMASKKKGDQPATSGGLAAMAAASKKKGDQPASSGGLAAMAAMASKKTADQPAATGGLAAMAAMASKKKADQPAATGGLAAMAAMAAQKKGAAPSSSGGLAAMASQKKKESAPAPGGIAAMAALAAQKKEKPAAPPAGGIAAMAAMAAQKKSDASGRTASISGEASNASGKGSMSGRSASGGLVALAAAARSTAPDLSKSNSSEAAMSAHSAAGDPTTEKEEVDEARESFLRLAQQGANLVALLEGKLSTATTSNIKPSNVAKRESTAKAARPDDPKVVRAMKQLQTSFNPEATSVVQRNEQIRQTRQSDASSASTDTATQPPGSAESISGRATMTARSASGHVPTTGASKDTTTHSAGLTKSSTGKETMPGSTASGRLATMRATAQAKTITGSAPPAPSSRGVSPALSDSARKRKVYDETSGLYNHERTSSASSFAATPNDTLFQLGSSGDPSQAKATPRRARSLSGDGVKQLNQHETWQQWPDPAKTTPSKTLSGDGLARVPHRRGNAPYLVSKPSAENKTAGGSTTDSAQTATDSRTQRPGLSEERPGMSRTAGSGKTTSLGRAAVSSDDEDVSC